jgi:hypothetical protein
VRINFDLKRDVADDLRREAEAQGRSVSDIMRQLIVDYLAMRRLANGGKNEYGDR